MPNKVQELWRKLKARGVKGQWSLASRTGNGEDQRTDLSRGSRHNWMASAATRTSPNLGVHSVGKGGDVEADSAGRTQEEASNSKEIAQGMADGKSMQLCSKTVGREQNIADMVWAGTEASAEACYPDAGHRQNETASQRLVRRTETVAASPARIASRLLGDKEGGSSQKLEASCPLDGEEGGNNQSLEAGRLLAGWEDDSNQFQEAVT